MKNKISFLITLLFLFFLNVKASGQYVKYNDLSALPDADVYDINGVHTTLHALAKNKVLFVDCWFIPCGECFMAMGVLHKVYAEYAGNKNFCFVTLCMTDSGQVKQFIKQDTVMKGYISQYQYFSGLKNFKLPVYFIDGCNSKVPTNTKILSHFAPDDKSKCPDMLFKFIGYPTSMIYNKKGELIFKENGFDDPNKYEERLTKALNDVLAENISKP